MRVWWRRAGVLGGLLALAGCTPRGTEALRQGDEALVAGRPAAAVPLLERAVSDLPGHAVAWNQLGLAYQGAGRREEARKAYLRALEFDRNLFDVHFNLGALEFEAGRWTETERAMRTYLGIERNRTNLMAWRMLGEAQLATHQFDLAERTLTASLQLAPNDPELRNRLGLVLAQKRRWRDATAQFNHVLRLNPQAADARLNLAIVSQQSGDRAGALQHYRSFLTLVPTGPQAEAVQNQVRQLEFLLAPPPATPTTNVASVRPPPATPEPQPAVVTNPPPVVTRPPPVEVTAPPVTRPAPVVTRPAPTSTSAPPVTRPVPTPTPTPPPTVVQDPKPVEPPRPRPAPVEVVPVQEAPPLTVARDASLPQAEARVREADVAETPPSTPPAADPTVSEVPAVPTVPTEPATLTPSDPAEPLTADDSSIDASRRTFWQRVNPVNWGNPMKWFRDKEDVPPPPPSTERTLAQASTTPPAPESSIENPAPEPTPPLTAVSPPTPSKPVVPRYARHPPPVLERGDRSAAENAASEVTADRLSAWKKATQLDPSWSMAWLEVGRLALESGHPAEALTAGEVLVALEPQSAGAHQLFAAALARTGFPADAAVELERAITLGPGNASVHLALAGIYARDLAEPALARPHYEQVLVLEPQHPQAAAIRVWLATNP